MAELERLEEHRGPDRGLAARLFPGLCAPWEPV